MTARDDARRRRMARVLVGVGALCLLLALPFAYADRNLFSAQGFADNAASALSNDAVRASIAARVSDELVLIDPRAVSASPLLRPGLEAFLDTGAARSVIRVAAIQTHNAFFSTDRGSVVVDLANVSIIAAQLLRSRSPKITQAVERNKAIIVPVADRSVATSLAQAGERVRIFAIILPLLALLCFTGAQFLTPGRRQAAGEIGIAVFTTGIVALVLAIIGRGLALAQFSGDDRDVVLGVLNAFTGTFTWWCLSVALTGAIVAASAVSLIGGIDPADVPRIAWNWIRRPRSTMARQLLGTVVLLGAGAVLIANPLGALQVVATIGGAYLVFAGVAGLLALVVGPATPGDDHAPEHRALRRTVLPWTLGGAVVVLGTIVILTLVISSQTGRPPQEAAAAARLARGCNGSELLCDRRFDQVTFPTTHNAMSNAQEGFVNANQGLALTRQLDLGIRGLQIDLYLGQRNEDGVVRTNLAPKAVKIAEEKLGAEGLAAVQRLAGRVAFGPIEGEKQLYACHVVCELGATKGVDFLRSIRQWLDRHPNEVLAIMIEDGAPTAAIKDAIEEAGLAELASDFQPAPGTPYPTLREMLRSGKRVWIAAEEKGDPTGWYHRGYDVTQETPFSFSAVAQLESATGCRPNRGPADAPLFLINSWVETYPPNPKNAQIVNQKRFLVDRARRCQKIRGRWPWMLAVDFAERGDIVGAAAQLNGVSAAP